MDKKDARIAGLQRRASLSAEERAEKSRRITEKILPLLAEQTLVGCYVSMRDEVSTEDIIRFCLANRIPAAVPRVQGKTLVFMKITPDTRWTTSSFGVREPEDGEIADPEEISLMIVPLSAFDDSGNRTGYGKGFYDSVLGRCQRKTGIAFAVQKCSRIEADPWDVQLDSVITEE